MRAFNCTYLKVLRKATKIRHNNQYINQVLKKQAGNSQKPSRMEKMVLEAKVHNGLQRLRNRRKRKRRRRSRRPRIDGI
jgi:hypothetical protein